MAIIGSSLPRLGGDRARDRRSAIHRRHPPRQRAARQARFSCAARMRGSSPIHTGEAAWRCRECAASSRRTILPQPVPRYGPVFADRPMLAVGETKFSGEPVAAVVAETEGRGEAGGDARSRRYRRAARRPVDRGRARSAQSPLVQDPALRPDDPLAAHEHAAANGSSAGATSDGAAADLVIERDYAFPMVTHFAIEPHAFLAAPDANGVTIWSPTQHPYVLQRVVAAALQLADRESADHRARSRRRLRRQRAGRRSSR